MARFSPRRLMLWLAAAVVAVAVLVVGGTFVYIHFIEGPAPAPLSLRSSPAGHGSSASAAATSGTGTGTGTTSAGSVPGRWDVSSGSVVGYRVNEVLFGQNNVAVGRTSKISGDITIAGGSVTGGHFTVQMATVKSDQSERDVQFNGRIMETDRYPAGTLTLTRPIALGSLPADGAIKTYAAAGNLTLHGRTRPVTFRLSAERTAAGIAVSGSIPVKFADYSIENPSFGSMVTTQNHGLLEFLLKFRHA